ncbi:MAG: hypothetical protein Q9162_002692 [Coniocarpon cinnabarinum]
MSRLTQELEFVQALSNPYYLHHLSTLKYFDDPAFLSYLSYLRYWQKPEYARLLTYPAPTLRVLELLAEERFRRDVGTWEGVAKIAEGWMREFGVLEEAGS